MSTTGDDEVAGARGFTSLTREEQTQVVCGMADRGMSDHTIAATTLLAVEMTRAILGERAASKTTPEQPPHGAVDDVVDDQRHEQRPQLTVEQVLEELKRDDVQEALDAIGRLDYHDSMNDLRERARNGEFSDEQLRRMALTRDGGIDWDVYRQIARPRENPDGGAS